MRIREKLCNIQNELKVPKNQFNKFGNYKYRSCEDIIEAVKEVAKKYNAVLVIDDELILIGDRYYIKAVATILDIESNEEISVNAFAREDINKKGMDLSQLTGSTSSYARKYALNGLLGIDDTKDDDTKDVDTKYNTPKQKETDNKNVKIDKNKDVKQELNRLITDLNLDKKEIALKYNLTVKSNEQDYKNVIDKIKNTDKLEVINDEK